MQYIYCYTCNLNKDNEPKVDQATCPHTKTHDTNCPTRSGCYIIHETVCETCGKVLSHSSTEITDPWMQKVHQHDF